MVRRLWWRAVFLRGLVNVARAISLCDSVCPTIRGWSPRVVMTGSAVTLCVQIRRSGGLRDGIECLELARFRYL